MGRRLVLVAIVLFIAYRNYGDMMLSALRGPDPQKDIVITRSEFRPELPQSKPGWIIGFRNDSSRYTYDDIQLEATFIDGAGKVVETDMLVVKQKLPPGYEHVVGSTDFKSRAGAAAGSLRVIRAQQVEQ